VTRSNPEITFHKLTSRYKSPAARLDYFRFGDNPPNHLRSLVTGFFAQNRAVIQLHKQHQS